MNDIPEHQRIKALTALAQNPHLEVRLRIFEVLLAFSRDAQKTILGLLTIDDDPAIRLEATERLTEWSD
jgi:hypothetical protein